MPNKPPPSPPITMGANPSWLALGLLSAGLSIGVAVWIMLI